MLYGELQLIGSCCFTFPLSFSSVLYTPRPSTHNHTSIHHSCNHVEPYRLEHACPVSGHARRCGEASVKATDHTDGRRGQGHGRMGVLILWLLVRVSHALDPVAAATTRKFGLSPASQSQTCPTFICSQSSPPITFETNCIASTTTRITQNG